MCKQPTGRGFESHSGSHFRGVVQFGRTLGLGPRGRMFKSCRPDHAGLAERSKAAVLKTVERATVPKVRILYPAPIKF